MSSFSVKNFLSTFSVKITHILMQSCLSLYKCMHFSITTRFKLKLFIICILFGKCFNLNLLITYMVFILECIVSVGWSWDRCYYWLCNICVCRQFPKEKPKKKNPSGF